MRIESKITTMILAPLCMGTLIMLATDGGIGSFMLGASAGILMMLLGIALNIPK